MATLRIQGNARVDIDQRTVAYMPLDVELDVDFSQLMETQKIRPVDGDSVEVLIPMAAISFRLTMETEALARGLGLVESIEAALS